MKEPFGKDGLLQIKRKIIECYKGGGNGKNGTGMI